METGKTVHFQRRSDECFAELEYLGPVYRNFKIVDHDERAYWAGGGGRAHMANSGYGGRRGQTGGV